MDKKKKNSAAECTEEKLSGEQAPETGDVKEQNSPETEAKEELPETITLSRKEFEQVKEHIEKLQKERDDTVNLVQRLQADFDNFRKRNASVHLESLEEGARNLVKELLPVLDNFDRAMEKAGEADSAWADGIKLVQKQLMDVLKKNGLEEIPANDKFDPELHEAVMQDDAQGVETNTITAVLQKGYKVNDRIIRHSMVKVAK